MKRETLKIVIIGHVDHGKSTLIGRLLLDTHSLPKERFAEIKKISKELGRDTELAYLADQLKEEREQNITIDTTQIFFKTKKRNYVIIDAPGHVEFIKNMITGASLAEAAVLIVDADEGVMTETRRHLYLASMLGLDNVIVVFNKMDLAGYGEEKFRKVKAKLTEFLKALKKEPRGFIPISAREGVNISAGSRRMPWYKGPTLLKALDSLELAADAAGKPLRFPVQDIYEIEGEKVIVGRVASGVISRGQRVAILPSVKGAGIKSIRSFGERKREAREGESIGLTLDKTLSIQRGEIIAQKENPPQPRPLFKGDIFWMSNEPLEVGRKVTLRCATQEAECVAEKIEKRINSSTLEIIEENANQLKQNEVGVVAFRTEKPVVIERFSFTEELGRFTIEREYNLQGAGIVTR